MKTPDKDKRFKLLLAAAAVVVLLLVLGIVLLGRAWPGLGHGDETPEVQYRGN